MPMNIEVHRRSRGMRRSRTPHARRGDHQDARLPRAREGGTTRPHPGGHRRLRARARQAAVAPRRL